jgi:hypothetical protein
MDEPKNVKFKANEITKSIQWKQLESIGTSRPSTAHTIYRTKTPLPKLVSRPTTGKSIQSRPETAYIESRPQTPHLSRLFQRQEQLERTARAYSAKERLVVSSTRFIRNIPVLDLLMTPAELLLGKESLPTVPRNSLQLDPLAVRFIEQDQKTDHRGKVFLIMNGRIIKEEVAFQLFLDSICEESWPLAMHIISFIETISKHYHGFVN